MVHRWHFSLCTVFKLNLKWLFGVYMSLYWLSDMVDTESLYWAICKVHKKPILATRSAAYFFPNALFWSGMGSKCKSCPWVCYMWKLQECLGIAQHEWSLWLSIWQTILFSLYSSKEYDSSTEKSTISCGQIDVEHAHSPMSAGWTWPAPCPAWQLSHHHSTRFDCTHGFLQHCMHQNVLEQKPPSSWWLCCWKPGLAQEAAHVSVCEVLLLTLQCRLTSRIWTSSEPKQQHW